MCPTCVLVAAVSAAALSRAPFETRVCARAPSSQSRQIGFDELYEFVRGKRHALDPRHKKRVADLRMLPPPGAECTLEEIAWSVDVLRPMLLSSMQRGYIGSGDLISAWDKNGDGDLSEFEFVGKMRTLFAGHDRLWKVRRTVSGIEPLRSAAGWVRLGDAAGWVRSGTRLDGYDVEACLVGVYLLVRMRLPTPGYHPMAYHWHWPLDCHRLLGCD